MTHARRHGRGSLGRPGTPEPVVGAQGGGIVPAVLLLLAAAAVPASAQPATAGPEAELPPSIRLPTGQDGLLRVEHHPEEGRLELVVGPVELPPELPHLRLPIQMARWPAKAWFQGFSWQLRDADGDTLPDAMLHHLNLIDPDHRQLFSPIARRLVAAGRETGELSVPELAGVPVEEGTRLMVVVMLANPTPRRVEEAYLHMDLRYTAASDAMLPRLSVRPFYLDVMGPVGDKSFPVPPGRTVKSWTGSPATDARILAIGGHLHDYAVELRLEDVTAGEIVWRAEPETRGSHQVVGVPVEHLWWRGGRKLHADHRYRVSVVYRNPTDRPAPHGGMGVVGGLVRVEDGSWARADRSDPAYLADLWNTVTGPERARRHHGDAPRHGAIPGTLQSPEAWVRKIESSGRSGTR